MMKNSERMDVQTNSEITDISDRMVSAVIHLKHLISQKVIFPILLKANQEPNTDISSEVTEKFDNSEDQGFTDEEENNYG